MTRRILTLLLALASSLFAAAALTQDRNQRNEPAQSIRILDAIYGQDQRICSVYDQVARDCDGREYCEVRASNTLCEGRDPYRNVAKQLFIGWECGDGRRSVTVEQERVARVYCLGAKSGGPERVDTVWQRGNTEAIPGPSTSAPEPRPNWVRDQISVTVVRYGAFQSYCDATANFASACDRQSSCSLSVDNSLCGDPYSGVKKRAYITYQCNGEDIQGVVKEGDTASLRCPSG